MCGVIELTQGQIAVVDDEDFEYLSQWSWYARRSGEVWYAARSVWKPKTMIHMHHVVATRMGLDFDTVDHINGCGTDNRRENLREATQKQQCENRKSVKGRRGVHWHKATSKWRAMIEHNGKRIHLGLFEEWDEAVLAREQAEEQYYTHAVGR